MQNLLGKRPFKTADEADEYIEKRRLARKGETSAPPPPPSELGEPGLAASGNAAEDPKL